MPCLYFKSQSAEDCKSSCDSLESCVAFDIFNNDMCNIRFLSITDARAGGVKTGHAVWEKGCRDACKSAIVGMQPNGEKGICYAKEQG